MGTATTTTPKYATLHSIDCAQMLALWARRVGPIKPSKKPIPVVAQVTTVDGFRAAFRIAKKGEAVLYHTGLLMFDSQFDGVLRLVGREALQAAESGFVRLVQRRIGPLMCEYLAIKRSDHAVIPEKKTGSAGWRHGGKPDRAKHVA